jgi:hypothetical protein
MFSFTDDKAALWTLRVAVALTCVAVATRLLMYGGPVLSWLWMEKGWTEQAALRLEHGAAFGLLACIPLIFWRKAWPCLVLVAGWLMVAMIAETAIGTWRNELTPGALASRWLAPVALIALTLERRRPAEWLLRAGAAATFLCHGLEAIYHNPLFIDYIISGGQTLLGARLGEHDTKNLLVFIGAVDVMVAVAIIAPVRWRAVALWMAFWGFLMAAARILYMGWANWPEALIRVTNGAVPLTLLLLWSRAKVGDESIQ